MVGVELVFAYCSAMPGRNLRQSRQNTEYMGVAVSCICVSEKDVVDLIRCTCHRNSQWLVSSGCGINLSVPSSKFAAWTTHELAVHKPCNFLN